MTVTSLADNSIRLWALGRHHLIGKSIRLWLIQGLVQMLYSKYYGNLATTLGSSTVPSAIFQLWQAIMKHLVGIQSLPCGTAMLPDDIQISASVLSYKPGPISASNLLHLSPDSVDTHCSLLSCSLVLRSCYYSHSRMADMPAAETPAPALLDAAPGTFDWYYDDGTYEDDAIHPAAPAPVPPTDDAHIPADSPPHSLELDTTMLWEPETAATVGELEAAGTEAVVVVPLAEAEEEIVLVEHEELGAHTPPGTPPARTPSPAPDCHPVLMHISPPLTSHRPSPTRDQYNHHTHNQFEHPRHDRFSPCCSCSRGRYRSLSRSHRLPSHSHYGSPHHDHSHSPY
jgi:hypothetical protein